MNFCPKHTQKLKQAFFAFLLVTGLSSCENLTEIDANGIVRDASTQQPLDSARVSLYEDNDGPFMGTHLLQETTTDASGKFSFNFEYKEGPYKIFVTRPAYRYTRIETNKITNHTVAFEYQEIAALENEQHLTFDLNPQAFLTLKLKNEAPALATDQIKLEVGNNYVDRPSFMRTFEGMVEMDLPIGNVDANTPIPIKYEVRENNVWRTVQTSVTIPPRKTTVFDLKY